MVIIEKLSESIKKTLVAAQLYFATTQDLQQLRR